MIELRFKHCKLNELVLYRIDRKNKKFWISSSKTNYKIVETNWLKLLSNLGKKS